MSVSIALSPSYPTTKKPVKVTFTLSGGGNFLRLWVTDAPLGSEFKTKLDQQASSRIQVFEGDTPWEFHADVGGVYVFSAQEYTKGASTFGGGYKRDPRGFRTETKIGSENSLSIQIGQRVTQKLGTGSDTATLVLWVWNDTIRPTTWDLHGEVSPAVVKPSSEKSKTAAADTSVLTAASALSNVTASAALGSISSVIDDIITKYNLHRTQATVHNANDADNAIGAGFKLSASPDGQIKSAQEIVKKLDRHMHNTDGGAGGIGGTSYHAIASTNRVDWTNALIVLNAGDLAGVLPALADAWRAFEAHRVSTGVHTNADNTNALTALPALLALHKAFLSAIKPTAPTTPATANPGVTTLVHGAGFKEEN